MTRVPENMLSRSILADVIRNRRAVGRYSNEISSGLKVSEPGDSKQAGTVSQLRDTLEKIQGYRDRTANVAGFVAFQDSILGEANDLLVRAQEIAEQGANETNSPAERAALSEELFELREHMVSLANSTYQGRYIYAGAADDQPAFSLDTANPYPVPGDGSLADNHYEYTQNDGNQLTRTVQVTADLTITMNTPGDQVFANSIQTLTELGRSLAGYRTGLDGMGDPDPVTSTAYTFPADFTQQTQDITAALDNVVTQRETEIMPERVNVAGRLRRLLTAESLLELSEVSAQETLNQLQNADIIQSASSLTEAQTALEAALTVTSQILRQSILDFI